MNHAALALCERVTSGASALRWYAFAASGESESRRGIRGGESRQAKGTFSPVPLAVVGVGTGAAASVVLLPLAVPWREREEEEEASLPMSA